MSETAKRIARLRWKKALTQLAVSFKSNGTPEDRDVQIALAELVAKATMAGL